MEFKFKKQNQHGAWAMVFMPPILGIVAGGFHVSQLFFIVGWLFIFFAADHVLYFLKRIKRKEYEVLNSALLFTSLSLLILIYPIVTDYRVIFFFLCMIPFGILNAYFSYTRDERNMLNNIAAIIIFSLAGGATGFLNTHEMTLDIYFIMIVSTLYFIGSALVVKTVIREKNNPTYKWASFIYHFIVMIIGFIYHPVVGIAFTFGFIRAVYVYGRGWKPKQLGILEIIHVVFVTIVISLFMVYFR